MMRQARIDRANAEWFVLAALIAAFVGKVCTESATGSALFVNTRGAGFAAVPLAHPVGALIGIATAALANMFRAERPRFRHQPVPLDHA